MWNPERIANKIEISAVTKAASLDKMEKKSPKFQMLWFSRICIWRSLETHEIHKYIQNNFLKHVAHLLSKILVGICVPIKE